MSMMGERMGNPRLYASLIRFGFGRQTGIELPGEDPGLVKPLSRWARSSTESISQGYELMVTPLQLARGFCAYANGGKVPQLTLVRGVVDVDGNIVSLRPHAPVAEMQAAVDPGAAMTIRRILADVPLRGTASTIKREVPNWYVWNIFGKTGTSHISEGRAGYSAHRYNSTFMGGAPFEKPRLVIAMTLHDPGTASHYGGAVSGPGSARILERSLAYLQVGPSPQLELPPPDVAAHLVLYQPNIYKKPTTQPSTKPAAM